MRAKHSTQRIRTLRRRRLALALVAAMAVPSAPVAMAQSLPQGGNVVSGTATINSVGNNTTINQSSRGAIIDWGSFNIASGFGVNFQNGTGVTLNRVIGFGYGPSASFIDGSLTSTGTVFLVNRAGITFGGGAQVNVGGLVASTVDILDADFLTGTSTGRYLFRGVVGTGAIRNNADLVAGSRGVGFVGPNLVNDGSIVANGGSIGFAAGTTVTLDYVGDGLTQVTIDVPPAVDSAIIQSRNGSMTADGGRILLRTAATAGGTGGGIYASGTLRAQTISNVNGRIELTSNGGPVMLGAPGIFSDANSPFTRGTIDVSGGAGETGGSVLLQGNQVFMVNEDDTPGAPTDPNSPGSAIDAWGGAGGGTVDIYATDTVTLLPHTVINADATDAGNGGIVRVVAGGDILSYANISANAGQAGGNGGLVGLVSQTGNALVAGNLGANGSSGGDGGDIVVSALAGAAGTSGAISANGGVNGGRVQMLGGFVVVGNTSTIEADGSTGTGGSIAIGATDSLAAYGSLSARGGTVGGSIHTATGGDFDIQGLRIDAGSSGIAGTWTFLAPNITVVNGNDAGPVDGVIQLGEELQDGEINTALANGTNVTLSAGAAPSDGGNIRFDEGVDIFYDDGTVPLLFRADANGSITGNNFSIATNDAALSMAFNADASSLNNGFAGISFIGATLDSNGGNIQFYGQSDLITGMASSYDTGVELIDSSIATAGGNVLIRGASTGDDAGSDDAGVVLDSTTIDAGSGGVSIYGTGSGVTSGVILGFSAITAGSGGVLVDGQSAEADGVYAFGTDLVADGGNISLRGMGGAHGVYFDGGLYSHGGNISLHGEGVTAEGIDAAGPVDSEGGDITMYGQSAQSIGLDFGGGANSGMVSAGGDISLTGIGLTGGVALRASSAPVLFFGPADVDEIDSGGGALTVTGSASGAGAVGVYLDGVGLVGGAGDVTVDGSAPLGIGVLFANGAGVGTTTGAITLLGEGAEFGLDIADGAIDTDSGDITLVGDATSASATAGVRVTGGGLITNGGTISVTGTTAGGIGVLLGNGVDPFAIGSGGGAISIDGTGVTAGVQLQGNSIDSGGGSVDITGSASGTGAIGVHVDGGSITGGAGDINVTGLAPAGIGVLFAGGVGVSTTSGAINLAGHGATFGGDITLVGDEPSTSPTGGVRVTGGSLTSSGGSISVTGTTGGGIGVELVNGVDPFAIDSGGGAIGITGSGVTAGVLMLGNQVDSGGGAIDITGSASGLGPGVVRIGVWMRRTGLIGGAGDVTVRGTAPGGVGVGMDLGPGISTTSGAIRLYGTGANHGVFIYESGALQTDSGDILLDGIATATTAVAGVSVGGDGLTTNGGSITVNGTSAGGRGVQLGQGGPFSISSGGGDIRVTGTGFRAGVWMPLNRVDSGGGDIDIIGDASAWEGIGVDIGRTQLTAGAGDVRITGSAAIGTGVRLSSEYGITTTTGDISLTGIGEQVGLELADGEMRTDSGHFDLRGRGLGASSAGLVIGSGIRISTNGGGVELSGEGGSGAGILMHAGSSVDAGNSLVILRAGNNGSRDAISIGGTISSDMGVNLRPGGVDANGELTERVGDEILVGGGTAGFALSGAELALIDAPELVIGSNLHAGAIRVLGITTRNGNLTLQNDGGGGGIDLQAAVDVGSGTLALSSGGSITQTSAGAITAHSLLARADGDVLLAIAGNNVAATTLAGSAGGDFQFQDVDALAIGNVSAIGFDATVGALSSFGANGITAGGDVFVRNLAGDLTLNAGVSATNIDLVTAGRLQNVAGASLVARGDWRVWANTWEGETRGGLAGSGNLPNLYGCAYLGACGVTVPGDDNHFIYVQQPTALVTFDSFSREYGLPNPLFTFSVTGAILGDTAANVASGSATTTATIGSDVGNYAISGNFLSAAGYRIQFVPGNLAITPATLFFTADNFVRYLGTVNPTLTGSVTGFRNDDTLQGVFGSGAIWSTPAGLLSPIGYYPVNGGTTARNYVFSQAPGNATALRIIPLPQLPSTPIDYIRETVNTYLYDRNIGGAPVCAINASMADQQLASAGDELSNEWSKVRSRPNLTNCFESERKNSCGDF